LFSRLRVTISQKFKPTFKGVLYPGGKILNGIFSSGIHWKILWILACGWKVLEIHPGFKRMISEYEKTHDPGKKNHPE
jgi:hypothetical protein